MSKKLSRHLATALLVLLVVLLLPVAPARAAQSDLIITGTGLYEDVVIYPGDWGQYAYAAKERYYSSNNALGFHHIWKVWGYDLFDLIGAKNLKSQKYTITFYARDDKNTKMDMTIGDLRSRYYYPRFDESRGELVAPMIGFKRVDLYEYQDQDREGKGKPPDPVEVNFKEKPVAYDDKAPRLYFGQSKGNVSDKNMTFFLYKLAKIVVGEERSAGGDEQSGGASQGSSDPSPKVDGKAPSADTSKTDGDKKVATGTDEKKDDEPVGNSGESSLDDGGDESKADKGAAAGDDIGASEPGDNVENLEITETTGAESGKARRIWIVVGAILIGGLIGRGVYNYLKRRKEA